jgi:hypothetical protein
MVFDLTGTAMAAPGASGLIVGLVVVVGMGTKMTLFSAAVVYSKSLVSLVGQKCFTKMNYKIFYAPLALFSLV